MTHTQATDPLALAVTGWAQSPHGSGTLYLRLSWWYGRIVVDVSSYEEAC